MIKSCGGFCRERRLERFEDGGRFELRAIRSLVGSDAVRSTTSSPTLSPLTYPKQLNSQTNLAKRNASIIGATQKRWDRLSWTVLEFSDISLNRLIHDHEALGAICRERLVA